MQASALQSISRCYRLGLRRPAREFPARGFQSARPRRWIGASAAAGGADGGTAVEDAPATKGGKGASATSRRRTGRCARCSPTRRASSAPWRRARRRGADRSGAGSRCDPSRSRGGSSCRWSSTTSGRRSPPTTPTPGRLPRLPGDAGVRRATGGADPSRTAKSPPVDADEAVDEALRCGFGHWRVETCEEVLSLRVTKSGEAAVSRSRSLLANANKGAAITRRRRTARSRTTGKSEGSCPRPIRFAVSASALRTGPRSKPIAGTSTSRWRSSSV